MRTTAFTLLFGLLASLVQAGECCTQPGACDPSCGPSCGDSAPGCTDCPRCGSKLCCKVVPTTKDVKKTVFEVKCEPMCTTLPSLCHKGCNKCCGGCDAGNCTTDPGCCDCTTGNCKKCCDPCQVEKDKCQVPPNCGRVICKKTLIAKEVVCKVPTFKCVPVCPCCGWGNKGCGDNCGACGSDAAPAKAPEGKAPTTAPAPPPVAPAPKTTMIAPLPPVIGTSYVK